MRRLSIVVPYRGRDQHLAMFVPHLRTYFARDKLDRNIPYRVLFVEQQAGLQFNRGLLKNIGFHLTKNDSDYTCFHDIDYLPIWADYSEVDRPTPIVWFGAEERQITPGSADAIRHDPDRFYGGAVLIPNNQFAKVDGYSNGFWGWGYEDTDLWRRFDAAGIPTGRRRGTFQPLDHVHEGYRPGGSLTDAARRNQALLEQRWQNDVDTPADGLSTLTYEMLGRRTIPDPRPERAAIWEIVKVRLRQP